MSRKNSDVKFENYHKQFTFTVVIFAEEVETILKDDSVNSKCGSYHSSNNVFKNKKSRTKIQETLETYGFVLKFLCLPCFYDNKYGFSLYGNTYSVLFMFNG